jgi:NAD(P)-dependent dehydrogenase (short-subunit alcohol dehydrogenase family)
MSPPTNKAADLFNVNGLVAVITGGGSGLGLYAARALDANGAKAVYIVGRREETLQAAAKTAVNGTIKPIVGDVTDKASLTKIADKVRQEQGYINLLFANAGVVGPKHAAMLKESSGQNDGGISSTSSKPTVAEFQKIMFEPPIDDFTSASHVNCSAVFYTAIAFLDLLDAGNKQRNVAQDSQIIVTSSIAGFMRHLSAGFAYNSSKAATTHLVKMLSTYFAQAGFRIRANVVAPGIYPSEMTEQMTGGLESFEGGREGAFKGAHVVGHEVSPAERTGSEEDFAGTILYLASRAGAYLNGETLVSDGGRLSQLPAVY